MLVKKETIADQRINEFYGAPSRQSATGHRSARAVMGSAATTSKVFNSFWWSKPGQ